MWIGNKFIQAENINTSTDTWEEKVNDICSTYHDILAHFKPDVVCYELPAYMAQAQKQNKRGDIVKLTILAGAIHGVSMSFTYEIFPIPIINWKGQVEKKLMNDRVIKRMFSLGYNLSPKLTTHELDAIGIGLYELGLMK